MPKADSQRTTKTIAEIKSDPALRAVLAHREACTIMNAGNFEEDTPEWRRALARVLRTIRALKTVEPTSWAGLLALIDEFAADGEPIGTDFFHTRLPRYLRTLGQARPAQ